ncbi:MAG: tRNA dihydrouridine synthase DusB [Cellvibrionaceae bacterium]|nr:tRNA dihydrouridine synthase DusB [Cellvibrionaceae bacterium]
MFDLGPYQIQSPAVLAPMAGITDLPFRRLCRVRGAGLVTAEMLTADTKLWHSRKSQQRLIQADEAEPRAVQIAGAEPMQLAEAARACVAHGAQVIDINMGCPAKKVCNKAAGSALLRDEKLVAEILEAVVKAVAVPVTLKIRTGWSTDERNGPSIAKLAQEAGIAALTVHGRSRACRFKGEAEYDTIASIVQALDIPVIANGDINSPAKAKAVLDYTGAAAVMIGRAAQGRPWIFAEIEHYLNTGEQLAAPSASQIKATINEHLKALHQHYGDYLGVRIARKHMGWYLQTLSDLQLAPAAFLTEQRRAFNLLESSDQQHFLVDTLFTHVIDTLYKTRNTQSKEEQAA